MDLKAQREEIDKWVIKRLNELVDEKRIDDALDLYDEFQEWVDDPELVHNIMTISTDDV
jgi:hypothetical protein|tara:strand:- start:49 stop:225 length:177 start_codon:yes stop_codon:yes gene_type:complete